MAVLYLDLIQKVGEGTLRSWTVPARERMNIMVLLRLQDILPCAPQTYVITKKIEIE